MLLKILLCFSIAFMREYAFSCMYRDSMFEQSPESLSDIEILDILQSMKKIS